MASRSHRRALPKFHAVTEIAEQLGVSSRTVWRWIDQGELVSYRLGRSVRVSDDDLRAFLASRRDV